MTNSSSAVKRKKPKDSKFFPAYKQLFVVRRKPHIIKRFGREWRWQNYYLADDRIDKHLGQELWVGATGGKKTLFSVIDVDMQRDEDGLHSSDFCRSCEDVRRLFPECFGLQSSSSGGRQYLLLWSRPQLTQIISKYIRNRLDRKGQGAREVYPCGHGLRLPFGKDNYLVDENGAPLNEDWEEGMSIIIPWPRSTVRQTFESTDRDLTKPEPPKRRIVGNTHWVEEVDMLINTGLTSPGQRTEATFRICQFLKLRGWPDHEIVEFAFSWNMTKHNGCSSLAPAKPPELRHHIEQIVKHTRGPSPDFGGFLGRNFPPETSSLISTLVDYAISATREKEGEGKNIVYTSDGRLVSLCDIKGCVKNFVEFFAARKRGEAAAISRSLMLKFEGTHGSPNIASALKKWALREGYLEIEKQPFFYPGSSDGRATIYRPGPKLRIILEKIDEH